MLTDEEYKEKAEKFMRELPYMKSPYNKRNWGNKWHSLCSYHGKLKPSIAHWLVKLFTEKGETVLDPLSGVGTIPFEACLQARIGIGNDLSRLAYVVTKAKLNVRGRHDVDLVLLELDKFIQDNINKYKYILPYKEFGFNKTIPEYFHEDTYREILCARDYFIQKEDYTPSESIVLSVILHILHGNRPYALSRKSHPLTPYAPTGEFIYKNLIEHVKNKLDIIYKDFDTDVDEQMTFLENENDWSQYVEGKAIHGDAFDINKKLNYKVDNIITSPPFVASMKFYIQNWMRLWFVGWEPEDYKKAEKIYLESRQKSSLSVYEEFFRVCSNQLKDNGKMILHLGKSKQCDMAKELAIIAEPYFKVIFMGDEDVSNLEKHGIKDKGGTSHHQFLFLQKK